MLSQKVVKPRTKRGKRFLQDREPKAIENVKKALFIKAGKTNEVVRRALVEIHALKKPFSLILSKKNILRPFDDQNPLEYLCKKNDHSLFVFGFSSKKRPNSLVIGRTFDSQVLDMFELGIVGFKPMDEFKNSKVTLGIKPCLVFHGEAFSLDPEYMRLKCLLTDFFRGEVVDNIRLQGLEHVLHFTANEGKVLMRSYKTTFLKSGTKIPNVELTEIGPSFDFAVRRSKLASDDLYKVSKKQPVETQIKKKKNINKDKLGNVLGRIHMQKQDMSKLQLRKVKALKRKHDQTNGDKNGEEEKLLDNNDFKRIKANVRKDQDQDDDN